MRSRLRYQFADAVWESEALTTNERIVALAYADHAGAGDSPFDVAWVDWNRLSQRTGIRSKDAINRAMRGLISAGWLELVEPKRQHRPARYRLVIPDRPDVRVTYLWTDSEVRETDSCDPSDVRETTPEVRETTARGTAGVPDPPTDPPTDPRPMADVGAQPQETNQLGRAALARAALRRNEPGRNYG